MIRAKNEERHIGQTLDVLFSQTFKNIEVIVVDSGSTDRTLEIARKYPVTIYEIKPEEFTWGYSLNYGFQRAKGEYVVNLSAHALPLSPDWIETLIANFDDEKVAAVMSKNLPCPDCNPFDRRGLLKKYNIPKQEIKGGYPYIFANYSSIIRRSVWEKVHYDETLTYAEDHDWAIKVSDLGYKIIYEPSAETYHSHNETLQQIYKRSYVEACALTVLEYKKFTPLNILFDLIAGSVYDMLYVIIKGDNIKWFFFAPLRKIAINYARFKASRAVDRGEEAMRLFTNK
ncbi:MAG: glycosyltransferase family 2 protein [Nitrospirota bacterium]